MSYTVTRYIFPLESKIELSFSNKFYLDNPRTVKEKATIKNYIEKSLIDYDLHQNPIAPFATRIAFAIQKIIAYLTKYDKKSYALKHLKKVQGTSYIDFLVESWIILRFPNDKEFDNIVDDRMELLNILFKDEESSYYKMFTEVASYCHNLALLISKKAYNGMSFLLAENAYDLFNADTTHDVIQAVEIFIGSAISVKEGEKIKNWLFWFDARENLILEALKLDTAYLRTYEQSTESKTKQSQKQTPMEKLIHVGTLLKASFEHRKNLELTLLLLVSIIEYLVTRNPDNNKFNVEDSIGKQFNLKCAILIHNYEKAQNMDKLNKQLKLIYSQRSDLAHGNYKKNYKIAEIEKSVGLLFSFNRIILRAYIDDPELLEYLKDN